jgi:N-acetylneuraminic acid mutarotase
MRLLILAVISLPFHTICQVSELNPNPSLERDDAAAFSIGSMGYLVTGNHNGFSESNRLWQYNTEFDTWTEGPTFPGVPRQYASSFSIGMNAYLIGGISESGIPLNDVWEYASAHNTWTRLSDFPGTARWGTSSCAHQNFGYLAGGTNGQTTSNALWRFNPESKSWDSLAPFPGIGTREGVLLALSNSLVYVGGFSINPLTCQQETYRYSIESNSWNQGTDFPLSQSAYLSGNGLLNSGFVFSGWGCDNSFSNTVWKTDGLQWTLIDTLPFQGIRGMSSFECDGFVYSMTGLEVTGQKSRRIFRVGQPLNTQELVIYPNPTADKTIIYTSVGADLQVFDLLGRLVHHEQTVHSNTTLQLPSGTFVVLVESNGTKILQKLVVL